MVAIVAPVCDDHFGLRQVFIYQRIEAFEVRDFTAAYFRPDKQAVSVGNEVDLGREATWTPPVTIAQR